MEELKIILSEMGLSSYKIETYLTLLKIKSGTIQQIAKNSKVPACKIYENLKWLHENGYVTLVSQKPISYKANNPKSILNSEIEERKEKLDDLKNSLEKIKLNALITEKDVIQMITNRDAYFKKIKESVTNSNHSIDYIAKNWRVDSELIRLLEQKIREGVKVRALGPFNKEDKSKLEWLKSIGVKMKNTNPKETHFAVYDNSIVIISLRKEPKQSDYPSIWLKSELLSQILTDYFENLWKQA